MADRYRRMNIEGFGLWALAFEPSRLNSKDLKTKDQKLELEASTSCNFCGGGNFLSNSGLARLREVVPGSRERFFDVCTGKSPSSRS